DGNYTIDTGEIQFRCAIDEGTVGNQVKNVVACAGTQALAKGAEGAEVAACAKRIDSDGLERGANAGDLGRGVDCSQVVARQVVGCGHGEQGAQLTARAQLHRLVVVGVEVAGEQRIALEGELSTAAWVE